MGDQQCNPGIKFDRERKQGNFYSVQINKAINFQSLSLHKYQNKRLRYKKRSVYEGSIEAAQLAAVALLPYGLSLSFESLRQSARTYPQEMGRHADRDSGKLCILTSDQKATGTNRECRSSWANSWCCVWAVTPP
mgnify:FL=1